MHSIRYIRLAALLLAASILASNAAAQVQEPTAPSAQRERELISVLQSDAPAANKAITCKLLAIHGSSDSVAELAKLLPDAQLSSWARIALEAIPGAAADEALRKAAETLKGTLLIGTINSIGVRRDAAAVAVLTNLLRDEDAPVASAAAVALGRIADDPATQTLRTALTDAPASVRSAVAEGCVLCAERLHAEGRSEEAVKIYDEVRQADVPKQRVIEATRGAILARGEAGLPLLVEQFRSEDKQRFQLALGTAREFPGNAIDQALTAEMVRAAPPRAALIIRVMADRPATVDLAAIVRAAEQGPPPVRMAAVEALGSVGDASCLATLLGIAAGADAELGEIAKQSLADLPSDKVDAQIVALLPRSQGKSYPLLIELVGRRRIDAVPELLSALDHSDAEVRHAALTALGETVSLKRLPTLVTQIVAPKHAEDAVTAQQALRAASVRMPDREACAAELALALDSAPVAVQTTLLEILSEVGGPKALRTLATAARSDSPQLQDDASRLLGKWNGVDAAPVLLELARTAPQPKYQVRALRGYIGLARKFAMPESQRAEMCQKALSIATQPAEQQLVLDVLQLHPSAEALTLAIQTMQTPELKSEATRTALVIAQKLGGKADVTRQLSKAGLEEVKLEIVKAQYGAGTTQKDVTLVLRKHAGALPLIVLPSDSYNASFGGDPLPGSVKRLTVEYRINGKAGEASFAENALILLPAP